VPGVERLDFAERWLRDGMSVLRPALSVHQITVDMTNALARFEQLRREGVHVGATHLLIQAAAKALAANPQLHQIVAGSRRLRPESVDIGLSVAGETFVAPVLVIKAADTKSLGEIAAEIATRTPEVRQQDAQMIRALRRLGWLVPIGVLRRALLRLLFTSPMFRRGGVGTFQVSTVPVDWALSGTFSTAGVLVGGAVQSRVVAVGGVPAVRPMMTVTLSGDHAVWDGRGSARFLATVRLALESAP
jgi:pyruvate dehydrogenase E2 component (dihydrolipoamide acetyltransferase)